MHALVPEIISLILGAVVFASTVSTLVILADIKKKKQCADVDTKSKKFVEVMNIIGAVVSGVLVLYLIILLISLGAKKAGFNVPRIPRLPRFARA